MTIKDHLPAKILLNLLMIGLIFAASAKLVFAQTPQDSPSVLYVPLIGITDVPQPLAITGMSGRVTYNYAVKNFLPEVPLTNILVVDNACSNIKFVEGDDNRNGKLDANETWRYSCATTLDQTTRSVATVTGQANTVTATHQAYATVVVGQKNPAPIVSVVNITKVAYPLSLPQQGGSITFTYKVTNPGEIPLSDVHVSDDTCLAISGHLGDTNVNGLLDPNEVWIYTCTAFLKQTTSNTVTVTAKANGLEATDTASLTVKVALPTGPVPSPQPVSQATANFPDAGTNPNTRMLFWEILAGILVVLIICYVVPWKHKARKKS